VLCHTIHGCYLEITNCLVIFKVPKRCGRGGGTVSKIIVMFNVKFVRYDFRVCIVAMFIIVDIWTTSCIYVSIPSHMLVHQLANDVQSLNISFHTLFQNLMLRVSSVPHTINVHVCHIASADRMKLRRKTMYIWCDIDSQLWNHCSCVKAISIAYSECVSAVVVVILHEKCMYRSILSSVTCLAGPYFSTMFHIWCNFLKMLLNMKCVFWCSLQVLFATFLIIRRIQWDMIINGNLNFLDRLKKCSNIKSLENQSSGSWVVPCRWTDRHDEATNCFSQFYECALKCWGDFHLHNIYTDFQENQSCGLKVEMLQRRWGWESFTLVFLRKDIRLKIDNVILKVYFCVGSGLIYKSSVECLMKTVRNEGLFALYKGFLPVWIRMAPWSLTFWLSFEQIRFMLGATGF
jgi:hypothetical protein